MLQQGYNFYLKMQSSLFAITPLKNFVVSNLITFLILGNLIINRFERSNRSAGSCGLGI